MRLPWGRRPAANSTPASSVVSPEEQRRLFEAEQARNAPIVDEALLGIRRVIDDGGTIGVSHGLNAPVAPPVQSIKEAVPVAAGAVLDNESTAGWLPAASAPRWETGDDLEFAHVITVDVNGKSLEVTPAWLLTCFDALIRKYHFSAEPAAELVYIRDMFASFGLPGYLAHDLSPDDTIYQSLCMTLGSIVTKRRDAKKGVDGVYIDWLLDCALFGHARLELYDAALHRLDYELSICGIPPDVIYDHFVVFCEFPGFPVRRMSEKMVDYIVQMLTKKENQADRAKQFWNLVIHSDDRLHWFATMYVDQIKRELPHDEYDRCHDFFEYIR